MLMITRNIEMPSTIFMIEMSAGLLSLWPQSEVTRSVCLLSSPCPGPASTASRRTPPGWPWRTSAVATPSGVWSCSVRTGGLTGTPGTWRGTRPSCSASRTTRRRWLAFFSTIPGWIYTPRTRTASTLKTLSGEYQCKPSLMINFFTFQREKLARHSGPHVERRGERCEAGLPGGKIRTCLGSLITINVIVQVCEGPFSRNSHVLQCQEGHLMCEHCQPRVKVAGDFSTKVAQMSHVRHFSVVPPAGGDC